MELAIEKARLATAVLGLIAAFASVPKAQGRARSASAQQLLAQKLAIQSTLSLMAPLEDAHGEDEN